MMSDPQSGGETPAERTIVMEERVDLSTGERRFIDVVGETPAAPPDPWTVTEQAIYARLKQIELRGKPIGCKDDLPWELCGACKANLNATSRPNPTNKWYIEDVTQLFNRFATERQRHAALLFDARKEALIARNDARMAEADLTAARAEIAERDFRIRALQSEFSSVGHCCHQCAGALRATRDGDLRCTECDQQENELRAEIARLTEEREYFGMDEAPPVRKDAPFALPYASRLHRAEASLLALQQQIEAACESAMRLNVPIPQLVARLRAAARRTGEQS